MVATPWVFDRVLAKAMMHRIAININNEVLKVGFVFDEFTFKRTFEEGTVAVVFGVEIAGMRVEKVRKMFVR